MSETASKIAKNCLPDVLAVAYLAGGWPAVQGLARAFGGKRICIPKKAGDNHPLVVAAGRKAADAIMRRWGGEPGGRRFQVPRATHSLRLLVIQAFPEDKLNQLVDRLGVTYRYAMKLRQEARLEKQAPAPRPSRRCDPRQIDFEDLL
jgi:hypothetical protein